MNLCDIKYLYEHFVIVQTVMNLNKSRLPPSPRSNHARKPLYNLENLQTCSLERIKKKSTGQTQKQKYYSFKSPINEKSHYVQECVIHNANRIERTIQKDIPLQHSHENEKKCKYHKERVAANYIEKVLVQYYCFQCSLKQARKGIRLISISPKLKQNQKTKQVRKNQIRFFIQKAQQAVTNIKQCLQQKEYLLKKVQNECTHLAEKQKNKFEEIVRNVEKEHLRNLQLISSFKQEQTSIINGLHDSLEQKCLLVISSKRDILKNYDDCVSQFSADDFRSVMRKYWDRIKESYEIVAQEKDKYQQAGQSLHKLVQLLHELEHSKRQSHQFTFSKQSIFETPKSLAKINGVKVISSHFVGDNQHPFEKNCNSKSFKQNPQNLST